MPRSGLIAGYACALLVLLVGASIYRGAQLTLNAHETALETPRLLAPIRQLSEELQDAERSQRDYVITGDGAALNSYNEAVSAAPTVAAQLRVLAIERPEYSARVDTLVYFFRLRLAELGELLRLRHDEGFKAAQASIQADLQQDITRRIHELGAQIYTDVDANAAQTIADERLQTAVTALIALVCAVAAIVLAVLMTIAHRHQRREQSQVYEELEEQSFALQLQAAELEAANAELEATTREMVRETAVSEANQLRLLGILGSATDAIISFDDEKRIVYLNAAAERMLGTRASDLIGLEILSLIPEALREEFASHVTAARFDRPEPSGEASRWEIRALRADNTEVPIEASIAYAQATGKQGLYTAIMRDVSRQRQLEEQLRQSQKMEAVGRLAGGIAHDFNNLLTVIGASSDFLLQSKIIDPKMMRNDITEIRHATDRAAGLTRQLLAFSRRQLIQPKPLELNTVVSEMETMLRRLIGEDVKLETTYEDDLGIVRIDRGQLEQVIVNLVVNARDAMPEGGHIEIGTASAPPDVHESIAAEGDATHGFIMLTIRDTGVGMDRPTQARIFEPFFTTKEQGKGTGLGLPTVYGIVKQAGGDVVVHSEVGHGTEMRLYFPRVVVEKVEETPAKPIADVLSGTETILIVEDEEALRRLAHRILESRGYTVLDAANGQEAIEVMATCGRPVDMVVSDVVMPVMGGRELVERLLPVYPRLRVLFMTGYTEDTLLQHRIAEFGINVLEKPFTPESLARAVRAALDRDAGRLPMAVPMWMS